jgi:hypothetical protein
MTRPRDVYWDKVPPAYLHFAPRPARFDARPSPPTSPTWRGIHRGRSGSRSPTFPHFASISTFLPHFRYHLTRPPNYKTAPRRYTFAFSFPLTPRHTTTQRHSGSTPAVLPTPPFSTRRPQPYQLDYHAGRTHPHPRRASPSPGNRECPISEARNSGRLVHSVPPCPGAPPWSHGSDECRYITLCRGRGRGRGRARKAGGSQARSPR